MKAIVEYTHALRKQPDIVLENETDKLSTSLDLNLNMNQKLILTLRNKHMEV